jgi:hypothetical protein
MRGAYLHYSLMCLHGLLLHLSTGTLYSSDTFPFQGQTLIHMIIVQHLFGVDIPIRMVVTPASYLGGPRFKYRPGGRLS